MGQAGLVLLLLAAIPCAALNPRKALTQYSRTRWTQQHGLPQDTVRALTQTEDGYLWIGTDEGLARFDGYEFVVFNREHNELPSNSITTLAAGRDGSLWIGTPNGLSEYRDGSFRTYTRKQGLPDDAIGSVFVDHAGAVWAVAGGDLSRLDRTTDGKITITNFLRERDVPLKTVRYVTEDTRNIIYVAGNSSVARFEQGRFVDVFPHHELKDDFPAGVHSDRHGNLWVIGSKGLIERTPDGRMTRFGSREGLADAFGLYAFWEDRDGNIWIGTDSGVARLDGSRFLKWTANETSDHSSVLCLYEDREGNLWAGGNNGLTRLRDDVFTVYGKDEGLPSDQPNTVFRDHNGTTWIGFLDHGPAPLSPGMKPAAGAPSTTQSHVYSIRESRQGELLVSGRDGLTRIKDGQVRLFVPPDPLGRKRVYDALEDSAGRIWLALPDGLAMLTGDRFETVIHAGPVMLQDSFVTLAESGGAIWAGTMRKGLWRVSSEEKRLFTAANGLGSDQVRALYSDPDGTLWIGTLGGGLNSYQDGKFTTYRVRDGLLSDNIASVTDDGESLWLSTPRGICRIAKQQLRDLAAHRRGALQPLNYGMADGLRSSQNSPEIGSGGGRQPDGTLWFVTNQGIAVFNPRASIKADPPPVLHLLEMTAEGRPLDWAHTPQVPPGGGRVEMRWAAIHLGAPDQLRYAYKLDGLDRDWIPADGRRNVTYDNLRHGHYRFNVRAELPGGLASEAGYDLEMLPHFYETTQFRLLLLALLAGAVWGAYRVRVRQVRSRFDLILNERARLAREVHDTLAQGFVGIASQLDVVEMCIPDTANQARSALALARRMAHHSLTEARRSVVDLRAAALDDEDLASALQSGIHLWVAGSDAQARVAVDGPTGDLPEETAHHVLRIAQEAVTNAAKHAHPANISVELKRAPKTLALAVEDDGSGFDPQTVFESPNGNFGLIGMRERAERVGGDLQLTSGTGKGTRVAVTVPLP